MILHSYDLKLASIEETINIYFVGDVHVGNVNFDRKAYKELIDIIANDERGYLIGMGDYIDAINTKHKHFDARTIDRKYKISDIDNLPYVQAEDFINMMLPIKDKIICLLSGNHEGNVRKYYDFDVYQHICNRLDVSKRMQYVGMLLLIIEYQSSKFALTLYLNHGNGGNGKREGYPINNLHDVFRWSDCIINIMGHTHQLISTKKNFLSVKHSKSNLVLNRITRYYGISGTFLKTYNEDNINYFEHKGAYEPEIGCLKLNIQPAVEMPQRSKKIRLQLTPISFGY